MYSTSLMSLLQSLRIKQKLLFKKRGGKKAWASATGSSTLHIISSNPRQTESRRIKPAFEFMLCLYGKGPLEQMSCSDALFWLELVGLVFLHVDFNNSFSPTNPVAFPQVTTILIRISQTQRAALVPPPLEHLEKR